MLLAFRPQCSLRVDVEPVRCLSYISAYLQPPHVETKLQQREALTDLAEDRLYMKPHVV